MDIQRFVIYSGVDGHLVYWQLLSVMNNAAVMIHVHKSKWVYLFISLGKTCRSGKCQSFDKYK